MSASGSARLGKAATQSALRFYRRVNEPPPPVSGPAPGAPVPLRRSQQHHMLLACIGDRAAPTNHSFREPRVRVSFDPASEPRRAISVTELRRLSLIMAFLLQTALLKAALPAKPDEAPAPPSLAGELLIAAPEMGDPRFEETALKLRAGQIQVA